MISFVLCFYFIFFLSLHHYIIRIIDSVLTILQYDWTEGMNTLCSMWKTFNDEEDPSVRRLRKPSISNNEVSSTTSIRPLVLVIVAARKETKLKNAYFFALHLVQQLLLRGYRIRIAVSSATISEPSSVIKVSQQASQESDVESIFMKLSGAENSLEVTDISDQYTDLEYSFSGNVKAVFLVSWSPVSLSPEALEDPGNNMITRIDRILTMCQNVTTVKKLLITSCLVAITDDFDQSKVYSEADWNDQSSAVADHYAHRFLPTRRLVSSFQRMLLCVSARCWWRRGPWSSRLGCPTASKWPP